MFIWELTRKNQHGTQKQKGGGEERKELNVCNVTYSAIKALQDREM